MNSTAVSRADPNRNVVLAMLLVVYIFNFIDRQILSILAAPIQADLDLSDGQMGLLGGISFALLYSLWPCRWRRWQTGPVAAG